MRDNVYIFHSNLYNINSPIWNWEADLWCKKFFLEDIALQVLGRGFRPILSQNPGIEWSFLGNKEHFCREISLFGDKWPHLRALSACGQILQKNPGMGQISPPIQVMPGFWERMDWKPLPLSPIRIWWDQIYFRPFGCWILFNE